MNSFPTVVRTKHVGIVEFTPANQPHRFFDTWIEIEEVVHQVFHLSKRLKDVEDLAIVPILTGAGCFNTMLGQKLNKQAPNKPVVEVPVVARSYGAGTESGQLEIYAEWIQRELIDDHNVVIIDDIYDTGKTANDVTELMLEKFHPLSVQRAFLIRKRFDQVAYDPSDYFLFDLPGICAESGKPLFFAGMGMDLNYRYRNLDRVIDVNSGRSSK